MIYLPKHITRLIPSQVQGLKRDTYVYIDTLCESKISKYNILKDRILFVNNWKSYCDLMGVNFSIQNKFFKDQVEEDDIICIDTSINIKFKFFKKISKNWVCVNKLIRHEDDLESYLIIELSPCKSPNSQDNQISHFYNALATNTIVLYKINSKISLSIHGRNEYPNFNKRSITESIKNICKF